MILFALDWERERIELALESFDRDHKEIPRKSTALFPKTIVNKP
jgi:hypothetical protein